MAANMQNHGARRGNRLRKVVWGTAALLLLLPWIAMQFTGEVAWDGADFLVFGAMLAAACGACEIATRLTASTSYRAAVGVAVAAAFLLVWMNLAVGIIGSEGNPANLLYAGVLVVGAAGTLVARFQPMGMARAALATAVAQATVAPIALNAGGLKAFVLTAFFVVPWLLSAWLFRRAAREEGAGRAAR